MCNSAGPLSETSAARLVELVTRREVSAEELVEVFLDRIAALDPDLGAFVHLDSVGARAAARLADTALLRGQPPGTLHGLPIGVKDVFHVAGMPTAAGSRMPPVHPRSDAAVIRRLRAAGAIPLGKLTASEFSCGSPFTTRRPCNPWSADHVAGGSSAGSAIAVSARLLPVAVGGDTGGSVRIPASFCGVVGLRPTSRLLPVEGVIPLSPGIDTVGPMTRSSADAELLLHAMAGGLADTTADRVRSVAVVDLDSDSGMHPEVTSAVYTVARSAASVLGVDLTLAQPWALAGAWAAAWVEIYTGALEVHRGLLREHQPQLSRPMRWKLCAATALTDEDLSAARRIAAAVADELSTLTRGGGVLVTPTTAHPANLTDAPYMGRDTMEWTAGPSLAGLPALSLPVGLTSGGLPIGVQLIGGPGTDRSLLRFGSTLEEAGIANTIGVPPVLGRLVQPSVTQRIRTPLEVPPSVPVTDHDLAEVRTAVRRFGLPAPDSIDADGAARSLRAARHELRRRLARGARPRHLDG